MQLYLKAIHRQLAKSFNVLSLSSLCLVLLISGCKNGQSEPTKSKSAVTVTQAVCVVSGLPASITGNTLQNITYKWSNLDGIEDRDRLMVKVHFVNADGKILFQDDHKAPATNQAYSHEILIPLIPRTQTVVAKVGLYLPDSDQKYIVAGSNSAKGNKVEVARFTISPPRNIDDLPEARITFQDGWYSKEYGASAVDSWRWIGPEAICALKGADRDLVLYINGWVPPENLKTPQTLSLYLNGEEIGQYTDLAENFVIKRAFPKLEIGNGETKELKIVATNWFKPTDASGEPDSRTLSVMVKDIYFN